MTNVAIIGVGKQGFKYAKLILENKIKDFHIKALVHISDEKLSELNPKDCYIYENLDELMLDIDHKEIDIDLFIITTPHKAHKDIMHQAFKRGISVICDKPLSTTARNAREIVEIYEDYKLEYHNLKFGVIYQKRLLNSISYIKDIIDSKKFGNINRVSFVSSYFRPEIYFKSSSWLAKWNEEGGGVLINQAIHDLDLIAYLFGLPINLDAKCETKRHNIECEDSVTAKLNYKDYTLFFHTSTCEAAGENMIKIVFDNAILVLQNNTLVEGCLDKDYKSYLDEENDLFIKPNIIYKKIDLDKDNDLYINYFTNYSNNILIEGKEGIKSLLLMSAMYLSSDKKRSIRIPINETEQKEFEIIYDKFIESKKNNGNV